MGQRHGRFAVWAVLIIFLLGGTVYALHQRSVQAQTTEPSANDPAGEALPESSDDAEVAQQPVALDFLPKARLGYVDWVVAITQGFIKPRDSLDPNAVTMQAINFDVIFKVNVSGLPDVVFPHLPHTLWLDCRNCHPGIFLMQAGANPVTMAKILQGEFCGRCHGVVAFPISDCFRCHSRPK